MIDKLVTSKKARALIGTVLVLLIGNILAHLGFDLTPDQKMELAKLTGELITVATGIYVFAQGIADAGSKGATSSSGLALPESSGALTEIGNLFDNLGLKVVAGRKNNKDKE